MQRDEAIEIVSEVMCDVFDLDDLEYNDGISAADIEEWDSLSNIRFMVAVEKASGQRFTSGEIEALQNVGELVDLIVAHSNAA